MILSVFAITVLHQSVRDLEVATGKNPTAANYRRLADAYVSAEDFQRASAAFFKASTLYTRLGDFNAAKVLQSQGQRYETKIDIFFEKAATDPGYALAKLRHSSSLTPRTFFMQAR